MAPTINFIGGGGALPINNLSGSGVGFYGSAAFAASVAVGSYQGRSFITDSTGAVQGPEINNVQFLNSGSGILGQSGSGILLRQIPNYLATLNIQFTNDTAVRTQNAELRIFDRSNINNPASGVTTKVAQIIHPDTVQNNNGSGDGTWWTPGGSGVKVPLAASPGTSGLSPNGPSTVDSRHDWYVAMSASPDSIGSKTLYGLYIYLEYL
jgi:hypothetical protein